MDYNDTKQGKNFPKTIYDKINQETNYNCQGSGCTCKYIHRRTNYDMIQQQLYSDSNSSLNLGKIKIYKPMEYKKGNKYLGV